MVTLMKGHSQKEVSELGQWPRRPVFLPMPTT